MVDYDLGDKCTIILEDIGIIIEQRLIAVYEVIKDNELSLSVEFGNQKIKKKM